jgi:hypothetical protein
MLHAYLCTICFAFCYTSWRFYAFSRTNLLTRCHSVSSLFSAVFVFQKSYTGNILRIWWNKSQSLQKPRGSLCRGGCVAILKVIFFIFLEYYYVWYSYIPCEKLPPQRPSSFREKSILHPWTWLKVHLTTLNFNLVQVSPLIYKNRSEYTPQPFQLVFTRILIAVSASW